jgi:hypothetical protein
VENCAVQKCFIITIIIINAWYICVLFSAHRPTGLAHYLKEEEDMYAKFLAERGPKRLASQKQTTDISQSCLKTSSLSSKRSDQNRGRLRTAERGSSGKQFCWDHLVMFQFSHDSKANNFTSQIIAVCESLYRYIFGTQF